MKSTFGEKAKTFYNNLSLSSKLPSKVEAMNPYKLSSVRAYVGAFLNKYFSDNNNRVFVFGINPGRFGSGLTGVTFTDPVALHKFCGIKNDLAKTRERSSEFVYEFIKSWGGPEKFYKDFFLTAVSPLGFTQNGVNYNYYDNQELYSLIKPFIVRTLKAQLDFGANRKAAVLLGSGKNLKFFTELNNEHGFFKKLYALEHPRFIMQYRRKQLARYLKKYRQVFEKALSQQN